MQDMAQAFERVDAMIGPCLAGPMLIITNFTGHPSLALRCGFRRSPTRKPLSLAQAKLDQGQDGTGETFTVPPLPSAYTDACSTKPPSWASAPRSKPRLDVAGRRPPLDA